MNNTTNKTPFIFQKEPWLLLEEYRGLKIETNNRMDNARIKNIKNQTVASGDIYEMKRVYKRLKLPWRNCSIGDIVAVKRMNGMYYHYAIYIGCGKVIHYAILDGETDKKASIHKTDFISFLEGAVSYEILTFSDDGKVPQHEKIDLISGSEIRCRFSQKDMILFGKMLFGQKIITIFTPEETIKRAKTRLGEKKYNLATNNCEHFALWCKIGLHESTQVDLILKRGLFYGFV